ncbi:MAG: hypothetical protein ABS944_01680 [Solibacillus sp.]|jgi:hypothetical protein|uniref:hypothetical protein n=1 Tax=unclassified Solibacillus TaxID=2637870 RepID=UPI0030F9F9AE
MEGIIIMIVMFVLSSLFNKGKEENKKQTKQMPPFSSQPAPRQQEVRNEQQSRPKTLEDFANEVFGQLNEKSKPMDKKVETPAKIEVELPKPAPVRELAERKSMQEHLQERSSSRGLTERPIAQIIKKQEEATLNVVPSNQRELMRAIVMTEILGPPKAKRK